MQTMMNEQRERLIELVKYAVDSPCARSWAVEIADTMLRHGVIAPPCKVGDVVYRILPQKPSLQISEYTVLGFHFGNFADNLGHKRKNYLIAKHGTSSLLIRFPFDTIGKTIFLTKEEAEQALKERSNT